MNRSWIRPPRSSPVLSRQSPAKSPIPLLDRIQMDPEERKQDTGQPEKSLIETGSSLLSQPTSRRELSQDRMDDSNSTDSVASVDRELIGENVLSGSDNGANNGQKHSPSRRDVSHSTGEKSAYTKPHARERSQDRADLRRSRSSPSSSPHPPVVVVVAPDRASSIHARGSTSIPRPLEEDGNQASHSVTPESFVDRFLPLAQRIADVRNNNEDSEDRASSGPAMPQVNSSVMTNESLAQFSDQLMKLSMDLQHHHSDDGLVLTKKTQDVVAQDTASESRAPLGASVNVHHHRPSERKRAPEPTGIWSKPFHVRTPTPEYLERMRRSLVDPPSSHKSTTNHTHRQDPSRRHSSTERRHTSGDSTQHAHYRSERRTRPSRDYHDERHLISKGKKRDSDRRSTSPPRQRSSYSSSKNDRRNSSPSRYHRHDSREPLPHRRRPRSRSRSPERRHSSKKADNDPHSLSRRHIEPLVKTASVSANCSGLQNFQSGLAAFSQQGPSKPSGLDVPGLWCVSRGLKETGTSTFQFEIDESMASKWNIQSNEHDHTQTTLETIVNGQSRLCLSLELKCCTVDDVQMTVQNLGQDIRLCDFVNALSTLPNSWPPQGHLVISLNAESRNEKFWFPDSILENHPIKLEEFVHKGINIVRLIQLSDLSGNMFVLLANGIENDHTRLNFLLPDSDEGGGISFQKAIPTISRA